MQGHIVEYVYILRRMYTYALTQGNGCTHVKTVVYIRVYIKYWMYTYMQGHSTEYVYIWKQMHTYLKEEYINARSQFAICIHM